MLHKAVPQTVTSMSTGRIRYLCMTILKQSAPRFHIFTPLITRQKSCLHCLPKITYYIKHEPLRHPIFYYGHTACFFINKLLLANILNTRINAKIEHMCAVGVDEMSWDDLNDENYDWPSIAEAQCYRNQVRDVVDKLIRTMPMDNPIYWEGSWWPILMGIEHENIHIETTSAIFRQVLV